MILFSHSKQFRPFRRPWLLLPGLALVAPTAQAQERRVIEWPRPKDFGVEMLEVRQFEQSLARPSFAVDIDFAFTDRWSASGIAFEHEIVDDAGKHYKPVHYDHGNGLAIADVDGDRLEDVYFTSQLGGNALYKNLGDGTFLDITEAAGVAVADRISVTASFADIDNDGDPDLYVTTVRGGNLLFRNDGAGRFTDVTEEAGVGYVGHSSGAVFFDFDRDGRLDLFLVNVGKYTKEEKGRGGYYVGYADAFLGHLEPERTEPSILFRNTDGLHFEDVSAAVGLVDGSWSGDATFTDLNGDLYPDLYVLNMQGDDHYYENQEGRRFVDRTADIFPKTPWGTMGVKFFDYDNDGDFDLLLTDMHSDMSREVTPGYEKLKSLMTWSDDVLQGGANNIFGNAFYRNLGEGHFEEVSDQLGVENYWPWGVSVADLNADGFEDVFVTSSMNFPWRYGVNSLLINDRAERFLDAEFLLGVEPRDGGRTKKHWFDLDCDGGEPGDTLCQVLPPGSYAIHGSLGSRSAAAFDLDADGDLDILTNELGDRPMVLVSDLAQRRPIRFLEVRLIGTTSNRDGLGSTVRVVAGEESWVRYHDGKSGYLAQSSGGLYFGLGATAAVDRVEVLWPSGRRQTVTEGLTVNASIEIREPSE